VHAGVPWLALQRIVEARASDFVLLRGAVKATRAPLSGAADFGLATSSLGGSMTMVPGTSVAGIAATMMTESGGRLLPGGRSMAMLVDDDDSSSPSLCAVPDAMLESADPAAWLRANRHTLSRSGKVPRAWDASQMIGNLTDGGALFRASVSRRADSGSTFMVTLVMQFLSWESRARLFGQGVTLAMHVLTRRNGVVSATVMMIGGKVDFPVPCLGNRNPLRDLLPPVMAPVTAVMASPAVAGGMARAEAAEAVTAAACAAVRGAGPPHGEAPCHGVHPSALVRELHANRDAYFRREDAERERRGAEPARCAGRAVEEGGVLVPPRYRAALGSMMEERGCARVGLEVGSFEGANADTLLTRWPSAWVVVMVDPWSMQAGASYDDVLAAHQDHMDVVMSIAVRSTMLHGPRAVVWRAFGGDAAALTPAGSLDFVYLDARHDYTSVTEDAEAWWGPLREGGLLAGHDFLDAHQRLDGNHWEKQPDGTARADGKAVRGAIEDFASRRDRDVTVTYGAEGYPSWLIMR